MLPDKRAQPLGTTHHCQLLHFWCINLQNKGNYTVKRQEIAKLSLTKHRVAAVYSSVSHVTAMGDPLRMCC